MSITAKYLDYTKEKYIEEGIKWCEPMLAKEIEDEEKQRELLQDPNYYVEEKFDGTRGILHIFDYGCRVFSRRISEKTGWFCENSDSVPQIRDIVVPRLAGTILDGEMFIPNRPFKDVSSTLNCKWDKAVERQEELGKIVFHAFDILYYRGIRVEMLPLSRRKQLLEMALKEINSEYVELVKYYSCDSKIPVEVHNAPWLFKQRSAYPELVEDIFEDTTNNTNIFEVRPISYYQHIIANGGEGVIVKPKDGKYYYKRGWEYSKIKKFLTREVIIMGFTPPTKEYKGKFPDFDLWDYWETTDMKLLDLSETLSSVREKLKDKYYPKDCAPVSKFYCKGWVGNIVFGVVISDDEIAKLPKSKKFEIQEYRDHKILIVGECSGMDEEARAKFSTNPDEFIGKVIEVKANEIFNDTGKLRHPRFLRMRPDKDFSQCLWSDHVTQKSVRKD